MTEISFEIHPHDMVRVDIATGMSFEQFQAAFERAAPWVDLAAITRIIEGSGNWDDVRRAAEVNSSSGLMIYWRIDVDPLLQIAGHEGRAVEYLLGNHVLAESMYRHDHRAMLYAPLRVLIHTDAAGAAVFSIDRPSTVFAGLGNPEITAVGYTIEGKLANMLRRIGVDADAAFTTIDEASPPSRR